MDPGDLMHESILIAFEKLDNLRSEEAFLSFLCGISLRVLSNDHRRKRPETGHNLEALALVSDLRTEQETEKHLLYEAMKQLPEAQREALILYEITGFPVREVAEIQGCTEDAVKQRLKRGRDALKELLSTQIPTQNAKS